MPRPSSFKVGTAGQRLVRCSPNVTNRRSLPESTKGANPFEFTPTITCPEVTAIICSAVPLYGTCT